MRRKKEFERGQCKQCDGWFLKKPDDKEFCARRCKDRYHNQQRGRVTTEAALVWLKGHCITVGEAVRMGAGTEEEIRWKIRTGKMLAMRLFGRVLLNRANVMKINQSQHPSTATSCKNGKPMSSKATS